MLTLHLSVGLRCGGASGIPQIQLRWLRRAVRIDFMFNNFHSATLGWQALLSL